MSLSDSDVKKVAKLARIAISDDDVPHLKNELNGILSWIEQLQEVDVDGVEAMTSSVDVSLPMRDDVCAEGYTGGGQPENVTRNAPKTEDHFFVVPKVVE
ncbi:Asp-tRNA(Asn)/Glu-tRNA(Gln) amidotransferase subunit GatC [Parvularcula sp. ZS-1/3]|uniref:Aspartyl/glutamyl-tRNA(Asn/Gln) amidotransferase subunit C n=1 Tax=Parvularcula mediterranea TaxID=2732508 RepID=A0A7Y3RM79_9PROT|nr:Asp-tRNA(Asn)/Glu-tRNA(Gln) amidotransferase subunit GatC [Parvularcula mediterranea]NNU16678.1 Asp-tRNA(Asn)/Glu-tRNA(Gln) amidotransferase subunit GatC [Parvularcula mediterranea]